MAHYPMITAVLVASIYAVAALAFVVRVRRQAVDGFEDTRLGFVAVSPSAGKVSGRPLPNEVQ